MFMSKYDIIEKNSEVGELLSKNQKTQKGLVYSTKQSISNDKTSFENANINSHKISQNNKLINNAFKVLIKVSKYLPKLFEIATILLTFLTLKEMQVERNLAYQPNIIMNDTLLVIDTGLAEIDGESVTEYINKYKYAVDEISNKNNINVENVCLSDMYQREYYIPIKIRNIGVGVCKNFSCVFNQKSCIQWMQDWENNDLLLVNKDSGTNFICTPIDEGNYFVVLASGDVLNIPSVDSDNITSSSTRSFMITNKDEVIYENVLLPNGEYEYRISLPYNYTRFLRLIMDYPIYENMKEQLSELAPIFISLQYTDVQGKEYNQEAEIHFDFSGVSTSDDGTLQLEYMIKAIEIYK